MGLPLSTTRSYAADEGKEKVQQEFQNQIDVFKNWEGDLLMAEVFITSFTLLYERWLVASMVASFLGTLQIENVEVILSFLR